MSATISRGESLPQFSHRPATIPPADLKVSRLVSTLQGVRTTAHTEAELHTLKRGHRTFTVSDAREINEDFSLDRAALR
jgi:hypothetical protein